MKILNYFFMIPSFLFQFQTMMACKSAEIVLIALPVQGSFNIYVTDTSIKQLASLNNLFLWSSLIYFDSSNIKPL